MTHLHSLTMFFRCLVCAFILAQCMNSTAQAQIQGFCAEGAIIDCAGECGGSKVFDECKVCAGPGKTSYNTAQAGTVACCPPGSPGYTGLPDDCGKCGGDNRDKDECGKCDGGGKQSYQTAQAGNVSCCPPGTPAHKGAPDDCGVCGGNNSGKDVCGVCSGAGKTNGGCCPSGSPGFTGNPDACGVCGGDAKDCCPQWGVQINRMEGNSKSMWFNPETNLFPACAVSEVKEPLIECGYSEDCANAVYDGKMISLSEDEGIVIYDDKCKAVRKVKEETDDKPNSDDDKDGNKKGADSVVLPDQCVFGVIKYDSPISLLVDGSSLLGEETSLVQFPLDPNAPSNWVEWKASAKAPLLVYDPQHTGVITRADQLFGHWTFGGQPVAGLGLHSDVTTPTAVPWSNGYEALATLDANDDGQIAGRELEPLSLWFDINQDAVSQAGEVKPLAKAGVDTLFFKDTTVSSGGKNVYAQKGYSGELGGASRFGTSVDWYGRSAKSRHEILASLFVESDFEPVDKQAIPEDTDPAITDDTQSLKHTPLRGLYTWKEKVGGDAGGQGLLMFREKTPGVLAGITATEMPLNEEMAKKLKAARVTAFRRITGTVTRGESEITVEFVVEGQATRTTSVLKLDADGKLGTGTSKVASRQQAEERSVVSYDWELERVFPK
jgi:hypothetical protein